jgi:hypothetical protein
MLVLETKGQDTEQDQVKRRFLVEWVKAVNQHGGFGVWNWEVSKNPSDLPDILARYRPSKDTDLSPARLPKLARDSAEKSEDIY